MFIGTSCSRSQNLMETWTVAQNKVRLHETQFLFEICNFGQKIYFWQNFVILICEKIFLTVFLKFDEAKARDKKKKSQTRYFLTTPRYCHEYYTRKFIQ